MEIVSERQHGIISSQMSVRIYSADMIFILTDVFKGDGFWKRTIFLLLAMYHCFGWFTNKVKKVRANMNNLDESMRELLLLTRDYAALLPHERAPLHAHIPPLNQSLGLDITGNETQVLEELGRQLNLISAYISLLSWNACGLCKLEKVSQVIKMDKKVSCTVIQETTHLDLQMDTHSSASYARECLTVPAKDCKTNHSGG